MPDAYRLEELRFVAEFSQASTVAGTSIDTTGFVVPSNTIRTLLFASLGENVAGANYALLKVITSGGVVHGIRGPFAYDNTNGNPLCLLQEGNEVRLLPGDRLRLDRSVATAGSTMTLYVRYIDTIMPFQTHQDPYNPQRRKSPFLASPDGGGVAGGIGSGGTTPTGHGSTRGGRGEAPPTV